MIVKKVRDVGMSYGEEQKREIETIREKKISVKLSEADCVRLSELCGEHNITVQSYPRSGSAMAALFFSVHDRPCSCAWFPFLFFLVLA